MSQLEFDFLNPDPFYIAWKANQESFDQHKEILLLTGKLTNDQEIKSEIEALINEHGSKGLQKAWTARNKVTNTGDYDKEYHQNIKAFIAWGKKASELNLGILLANTKINWLRIFGKSVLITKPGHIPDFDGVERLDIIDGYPEGLPEAIASLTSMKTIELIHNAAETIPGNLANFHNLENLELEMPALKALPESLKNLPRFQSLELKENLSNTITSAYTLPEWLGTLTNLKKLTLYGFEWETLPENSFPPSLEHLELTFLPKLTKLPDSLLRCTQLKTLTLDALHSLQDLPKGLESLQNLESLKIEQCKQIPTLDGELLFLPKLKAINLTGFEGSIAYPGDGVREDEALTISNVRLLEFVLKNSAAYPKLSYLEIRYLGAKINLEQYDYSGFTALKKLKLETQYLGPDFHAAIRACKALESLEVQYADETLVTILQELPRLKELIINRGFKGESFRLSLLPPAMEVLHMHVYETDAVVCFDLLQTKKIKTITLEGIHLQQPENLGLIDCDNLSLALPENNSGEGEADTVSIPDSISDIQHLKTLKLKGPFAPLPEGINQLSSLEQLTVQASKQTPETTDLKALNLASLPGLKSLQLNAVPAQQITRLLETVTTDHGLETLILEESANLKTMPSLDRFHNLHHLQVISCEDFSGFSGPLPKSLVLLELRYCGLTPALIPDISALPHLRHLSLEHAGNMPDHIPCEWNQLESLEIKTYKDFEGIPACISGFQQLHTLVLDLFLESLPVELAQLKNLKRLHPGLSLQTIPIELASLELEELGMSFSKFSGNNIPEEVYAVLVNENTRIVSKYDNEEYYWRTIQARQKRKLILQKAAST